MHIGIAAALAGLSCVLAPLALVAVLVVMLLRRSSQRHAERMAMIERGIVPAPRRDPARAVGWAVGLVVGGVLWIAADAFDLSGFGVALTAVGAAYLTRGLIGLSREGLPPAGGPGGGVR